MARRGDQLRDHILWAAKDVFLEMGFERASMDAVAARAGTSKRSLYAHFESKERLYLAVIELVRGLSLAKLKRPGDHADAPAEALTLFCARYLEILLYEPSVQMCRISMAETGRFPQAAARHFDVMFAEVQSRLAAYLAERFTLAPAAAAAMADRLLGRVLYPRYIRALFGMDPPGRSLDAEALSPAIDLAPIRDAVAEALASLQNSML